MLHDPQNDQADRPMRKRSIRTSSTYRAPGSLALRVAGLILLPISASGQDTAAVSAPSVTVSGVVVDHTSDRPLSSATVELIGEDLSVLSSTRSDSVGAFTLTIRGPGLYALRGHLDGFRSQQGLPFEVRDEAEAAAEVRLSRTSVLLDPVSVEFEGRPDENSDVEVGSDEAGSSRVGTIRGTSLRAENSEPLDQVRIELLDEAGEVVETAVTNGAGGFLLRAPEDGEYRVRASRLGFATRTSDEFVFRDNRWAVVTLTMAEEAIDLDPIRVAVRSEGPRYPHMTEYYDRRDQYERLGQGQFIERLELEAFDGTSLTTSLPALSSVVFQDYAEGSGSVIRMRARGIGGGFCRPDIYIDGTLQRGLRPVTFGEETVAPEGSLDQILSTTRVESVEIYDDGFLNAPGEFTDFDFRMRPGEDGAGCGIIVIWTRRN